MSGLINSAGSKSGVIGFKTPVALAYGSATGDQSPVKNSSQNYTMQLNTEDDPYNIISISSNVVTVSYGGMYCIEFNSGNLLTYNEGGSYDVTWCHFSLHKNGSHLISGNEMYLADTVAGSSDKPTTNTDGSHIYRITSGDAFHLELDTAREDNEPLGWQGGAATGGVSTYARILFTRIGE